MKTQAFVMDARRSGQRQLPAGSSRSRVRRRGELFTLCAEDHNQRNSI